MTRRIGVLRPEPGNAATAARLTAAGLEPVRVPLFRAVPVAWTAPDPAAYDALILTSANAIRHAGPALAALCALPVRAVGEMTARAARAAGLSVVQVGTGGVDALATDGRLLRLAGRDHVALAGVDTIVTYASESVDADVAPLADTITLVHSARAGERLRLLVRDPSHIRIVAISAAVAVAAGDGWASSTVVDTPTDAALVAAAARLAD